MKIGGHNYSILLLHQRERYKTIDLVIEYNHFTWECNHLATFPPSSLETERENLNSRVL